ncbi:glycogen(starch) synthase [Synchytrium endobioticum]|nr:glycogen(starch) synthase [Synchytrium endobioticum]
MATADLGRPPYDANKPILFECAFEVANKVGGIYTVIKTKCPVTVEEYGDRYVLIGPLAWATAKMEVEVVDDPPWEALRRTLTALKSRGVRYVFGRWLVEGAPYVLLLELASGHDRMNEWKSDLWNIAGVPSPSDDAETNEAVVFGYLVAWFLGEVIYHLEQLHRPAIQPDGKPGYPHPVVIAHFHEWLAGVALILIRKRAMHIATIFTTHATLLGRYLCAGDVDFYNNLRHFNVDSEAAYEAEWLLKRKPDGVLPNGLNVVKFAALHEFQNLHARAKDKIHEFVRGHFYGHQDFDLDNTLYFFTAGRYEFRNKGVDMFVESLARLNAKLKHCNSPMTVVAFIIMPAATHSYTVEALKGQAVMKQLRDTVADVQRDIGSRIFESATRGKLPDSQSLLSSNNQIALKRRIFALQRNTLPPIVTHNMADDSHDPILNQVRTVHLFNSSADRVKVVFHPEFLSQNNPLMPMDYEEFVRGCHLGVFPSYYEPWGYTPAECTVMGVPSITTNLSGFGCFMAEMINHPEDYGIYIVDRRLKSVEESVQQLADHMMDFCQKSRRQRINQRNRTERLSDLLDWKRLGYEYMKARWVAIRRKWPDIAERDEWASDSEIEDDELFESSSVHHGDTGGVPDVLEKGNNYVGSSQVTDHYNNHQHDKNHGQQGEAVVKPGKKVARPASAPGSPKIKETFESEDGTEGIEGTFEESALPGTLVPGPARENPDDVMDSLRKMSIAGASSQDLLPPVQPSRNVASGKSGSPGNSTNGNSCAGASAVGQH